MIVTLLLCCWLPQVPETLWQEANQAYKDGQFEAALIKYEDLLEQGVQNGRLHFNLGNAYFKTGQLGKAILHYHKANRLLPGDTDVLNNLAVADKQRQDPQIDEESDAFARSVENWLYRFPPTPIFFAALLFIALAGLASLVLIIRRQTGKWLGYVLTIAGVLGLLLAGMAWFQYEQLVRTDRGILIADQIDVLAGPTPSEPVNFTIHEGIRCWILEERPGWLRIRLANGYNGWVPRRSVATI